MKTRIFYTKFWDDDYIATLDVPTMLLFLFLITNPHIGLQSIYECTDRLIMFHTRLTPLQLQKSKDKLQGDGKFGFYKGYIKVLNGHKYNPYKGEKNQKGKENELLLIPIDVIEFFDTLSIDYRYPIDSTIIKNKIKNKEGVQGEQENLIPPEPPKPEIKKTNFELFIDLFNFLMGKNLNAAAWEKKAKDNFEKLRKAGNNSDNFEIVINNARRDKNHIEAGYKWITPEYITRPHIFDKYLNF